MNNYTLQNNQKSIHAVIFTGGLYPEPAATEVYWKLHGAPDYVIAADSGLETLLRYSAFFSGRYDFTPQKITGDFDSISDRNLLSMYPNEIIESFPKDKDYTDTELAVEIAYTEAERRGIKQPEITLIGGDGGRIDHLLCIYDSFASARRASVWLCRKQAVYLLESPGRCFIDGLAASDDISIARIPVSRTGGKFTSQGLEWDSPVFRKAGMPSLSNRISEEYRRSGKPVQLTAEGADLLLIVPIHAQVSIISMEEVKDQAKECQ